MARILVVDDQPQITKMLEALLHKAGHHVTCAHDSFDAVEKVQAAKFEMVITDAVMPGSSGFELIGTLRKMEEHKETPIILLTGRREKKDVERGIKVGADDYLIKPVDPDLLLAKVESLLQKKFGSPVKFKECPVSEEATFTNRMRIVGVSEVGLTLHAEQPFQAGSKFSFASPFFSKVGMDVPILRVVSCEPIDNGLEFAVRVQFVGITENSLQPLRVWIRGRSFNQAG